MQKIIKHLPNFITLLNLLVGCFAIVSVFQSELINTSGLVAIAIVLDFLDGFFARFLNAKTKIGKQLDSLADVVSFGVVPGLIVFVLITNTLTDSSLNNDLVTIIPYIAFLIPIFSAIRLAKFNIDETQSEVFTGLPVPASAILFGSLPLILFYSSDSLLGTLSSNPYFLISLTIFVSILMVANINMLSLKFKNLKWKDNFPRYLLFFISLVLIVLLRFDAIPFIIVTYILISLIFRKAITK